MTETSSTFLASRTNSTAQRAFTIWEGLIVLMVMAMLLSIALPALRRSADDAMTQQSMNNLITLSASHFMYAADHTATNGR